MANVKIRAGVIRNAVGAPLSGKVATLKNEVTGSPIGTTVNTDPDGRYTFAGLDETIRYRVEVAFGGGSSQMHVNAPVSPDLDHAYVNFSLRSAPAATIAFGGPVSVGGILTAPGLTVTGQAVIQGNTTVSASELALVSPTNNAIVTINSQAAGTTPLLRFRNQANTGDNAYVDMYVDSGGDFQIRAVNDAYSVAPVWIALRRTGATLDGITLNSPVSITNQLGVSGGATVAGGLNVTSGNIQNTGTLHVTGAVTFDTTLAVGGLASLNGGLGVTGASTLNGAVNAASLATAGTLNVTGATTLAHATVNNGLTVAGGAVITGDSAVVSNALDGEPAFKIHNTAFNALPPSFFNVLFAVDHDGALRFNQGWLAGFAFNTWATVPQAGNKKLTIKNEHGGVIGYVPIYN